jgi:hypothetical protein
MSTRKFKNGDLVKVTKKHEGEGNWGNYNKWLGVVGTVVNYQMRIYHGMTMGSQYQVQYPGKIMWIETEYLSKANKNPTTKKGAKNKSHSGIKPLIIVGGAVALVAYLANK